jgi:hypothetical protein
MTQESGTDDGHDNSPDDEREDDNGVSGALKPSRGPESRTDTNAPQGEIEKTANIVFARIEHKLGRHLHFPTEMPKADEVAELREKAPEFYTTWLDIARERAQTENYVQRAPYEIPERLAKSGRRWGLTALIVVLGFCAFAMSRGGVAVYFGGIIAVLDLLLLAMVGLFFGENPSENREQSERKEALAEKGEEENGSDEDE